MIKSMTKNTLVIQPEDGSLLFEASILPIHRRFTACSGGIARLLRADHAGLRLQQTTTFAVSSRKWIYNPHRSVDPDRARNPRFPPLDV